jgi:hypothetical protein
LGAPAVIFTRSRAAAAVTFLPSFRTPAAYTIGSAITAQAATQVGDLTVIWAFGTGVAAPAEPGALMTTVDIMDAPTARKGTLDYRIATGAGATSFGTYTGTSAWGVMTFVAGTFDAVTPIHKGGNSNVFSTSEPDNFVTYPTLTAAPNAVCMGFLTAFSNLGPLEYGLATGATSRWNQNTSSHFSRGQTAPLASLAGFNLNHISGSAAQTLVSAGYIVGFT